MTDRNGAGGRRLFALTCAVMVAFAANSVLNRAALDGGHAGSLDFAAIRVVSGAATLAVLATWRDGWHWFTSFRAVNVAALAVYILGFSLAYRALPAGGGALILFAAVQITMFAGAVAGGEAVPARRWLGAVLALGGLAVMLLPGTRGLSPAAAGLMALAGIGWGVYSLRGRAGGRPLATTAASFLGAVPLVVIPHLFVPFDRLPPDAPGVGFAVLSGAVASGLGYALWYAVLPALGATRAALAQLTVPVIAVIGGLLFLGEVVTMRLAVACFLVVGGVGFGLSGHRRA